MKLYYSPGACSLSPHIVLRETDTPFKLVKTDLKAKRTEDGRDYLSVNAAGYVPALELDDGTILTEGPAIVQFIADKAGATHLAPANGTLDRYRLQSWLNFITSELHKGFSPLFNPAMPEAGKTVVREILLSRIALVDRQLASTPYLMGSDFTVADAYCFTVLSWTRPLTIDLTHLKHVPGYLKRIAARPAVKSAMKAEGLIK
jgi:glutathione S-transferase